jgi:hypothetical protein
MPNEIAPGQHETPAQARQISNHSLIQFATRTKLLIVRFAGGKIRHGLTRLMGLASGFSALVFGSTAIDEREILPPVSDGV